MEGNITAVAGSPTLHFRDRARLHCFATLALTMLRLSERAFTSCGHPRHQDNGLLRNHFARRYHFARRLRGVSFERPPATWKKPFRVLAFAAAFEALIACS